MHALSSPFCFAPWFSRPMELRIDVHLPPDDIEADLERLYGRIRSPGDALHGMPRMDSGMPGLVLRHRQADGEHYVYVEDVVQRRLAGYTVFNRLIELDRRADRCLRGPHSKYAKPYQRRGIASAVYKWGLDAGLCLITGARQSVGAHGLWRALAGRYPLIYVQLHNKELRYLGQEVDKAVLDDFDTRMVLLGRNWTPARFVAEAASTLACRQAESAA